MVPALAPSSLQLDRTDTVLVLVVAALALGALGAAVVFRRQVLAADPGTPTMQEIAAAIQEGAKAYLSRQFRTLAIFAVLGFLLLLALPAPSMEARWGRSIFFLLGAVASGSIGYLGMSLAVRANVRVAAAARHRDREGSMRIAFRTGAVVGMATVGLGLLGVAACVLIFEGDAPRVLEGFGFGAALLAMFMRVGGGIFTKAADVGADLVGKVEAGIPEDDRRNAATIADNVGDNVGDCAGMAADLFESYAVTLVAALILGAAAIGHHGLVLPLLIPAVGVITALIGVYTTRAKPGVNPLHSIQRSFSLSAVISAVLSVAVIWLYLPRSYDGLLTTPSELDKQAWSIPPVAASLAVLIGILLAAIILWLTGYFTGTESRPTRDVARTTATGAATVVLAGIGLGLESAVYKVVVLAGAVWAAHMLGGGIVTLGLFYVALAGCGLLTTVGVIVAMDTFGPVSDNAQGIAEMSGDVDEEAAGLLTELDAVGNTTKAITKGIAIATAVLAATALFGSYTDAWLSELSRLKDQGTMTAADLVASTASTNTSVVASTTLVGLLLGSAVVFLFSGLAISAVTRAAGAIVHEVRRQFREHPGIMTFQEKPEYGRVVDMCTKDSLRELATPGLLALLMPVVVGFGLGIGALAGYLAGAISTGALMAVFLANAGGAWDNAKKIIEDQPGGKGSEAHAAAVIGDTIGDPFKDTAGPAINPLIKVMNLVAVLIAPAVVVLTFGDSAEWIRFVIAGVALAIVVVAVGITRNRPLALATED